MKLQGKTAIVTGGGRDIGREVSLALAKEGARVVINYWSSEAEAEETRRLITGAGGQCLAVKGDMTKWTDAEALVQRALEAFGNRIDLLVNVAGGLFGRKPIEEQDEAWFD